MLEWLFIAIFVLLMLAACGWVLLFGVGVLLFEYQIATLVFPPAAAVVVTLAMSYGLFRWLTSDSATRKKRCPNCKAKELECYLYPNLGMSRPRLSTAYYLCGNCKKRYRCSVNGNVVFESKWKDSSEPEYDRFYERGTVEHQEFKMQVRVEQEAQKNPRRSDLKWWHSAGHAPNNYHSPERTWSFRSNEDGNHEFVFHREVRNCHALNAKSSRDEASLQEGLWVVLCVAPWSPTSVQVIPSAIEIIQELFGEVQLGIHSYEDSVAVHDWCPLARPEHRDPAWSFFRNGDLVGQEVGFMGKAQLLDRIGKYLVSP